ncbi:MAG: thiamine pyrophosphate-binding protein [Verrucomicrobiota bacterium]
MDSRETTVGTYLLERLHELGLRHVFGVPGDYVLDFLDRVVESPMEWVGTCNELNAGYAADAYARLNGVGAAVVTYGVGAFSILNAVAGAYAEQVPFVLISGSPNAGQREGKVRMHHLTSDYRLQLDLFGKVTVGAVLLDDPVAAPKVIDEVLSACVSRKRPVYFEIPTDMVDVSCEAPVPVTFFRKPESDATSLSDSVEEAAGMLNAAERPVILAGVELQRFGLEASFEKLLEVSGLPFATTLDGKSVLSEEHAQFAGVYMGSWSAREVREQLDGCDCLLSLGVYLNDISTGGFTAGLPEHAAISAHGERVQIGSHYYRDVWLGDFLEGLSGELRRRDYERSHASSPYEGLGAYGAEAGKTLSPARFYDAVRRRLDGDTILVAEAGDALFAAADFPISGADEFVTQAYYLSLGYALPAAMGLSLAREDRRVWLLTGDGGFQMTVQEISTMLRIGLTPVIIVVNNDGYLVERMIHDGPYNDLQRWEYDRVPGVFGKGALGLRAETEDELEAALDQAQATTDRLVLINAVLPRDEGCETLERLGRELRASQKG